MQCLQWPIIVGVGGAAVAGAAVAGALAGAAVAGAAVAVAVVPVVACMDCIIWIICSIIGLPPELEDAAPPTMSCAKNLETSSMRGAVED